MMSNLTAAQREPETSLLLVPLVLYLRKSMHCLYKVVTLIFKFRIRNSICNHDFQNNYSVKFH